jgi:O-antigen ligase
VHFNQAHNHYLQALSEGGLLLAIPLVWTIGALGAVVSERLRRDRGAAHWIRAGAACGLLAVALQSAWETGLVMPANAALAAVLAAIAVHHRSSGSVH